MCLPPRFLLHVCPPLRQLTQLLPLLIPRLNSLFPLHLRLCLCTLLNLVFYPTKYSGPFPVRDVPADLCDLLLASHSARSMVVNEDFMSLDGSSTVTSHLVFDYGVFTSVVLRDKVSFEFVREDLYANYRASKSASWLSLPVCSVMPGVAASVDLRPRPSYVTLTLFPGLIDLPDGASDLMESVCVAFVETELDPLTYTADDIKELLPPEFSSFSECEQKKLLDALCCAEARDELKDYLEQGS